MSKLFIKYRCRCVLTVTKCFSGFFIDPNGRISDVFIANKQK